MGVYLVSDVKSQCGSFCLGKVMVRFEKHSFVGAQTLLSRAGFGHMRTFIKRFELVA